MISLINIHSRPAFRAAQKDFALGEKIITAAAENLTDKDPVLADTLNDMLKSQRKRTNQPCQLSMISFAVMRNLGLGVKNYSEVTSRYN